MELLESKETEVRQRERTEEVRRDMEEKIEVREVRRAIKKFKGEESGGSRRDSNGNMLARN